MTGAKPVEILLNKIFSWRRSARIAAPAPCGRSLRDPLRLIAARGHIQSSPLSTASHFSRTTKHVNVHRFQATIGGRLYQIEVTPVGNRWRAQLQRTHGMPTAMMPFYRPTHDAAAQELTHWLEIANRRAQAPGCSLTTV